jgi:SAM-dependent methyltransferase
MEAMPTSRHRFFLLVIQVNPVHLQKLRDQLEAIGFRSREWPSLLYRLFSFGQRISLRDARLLLADAFDSCVSLNLVQIEDESVIAKYRILIEDEYYLVLDPIDSNPDRLSVMPPSGSTKTLLRGMRQTPCETVVDLGTGCGLLALQASSFAKQVIAVDLNPRAIEFTHYSAVLNGRSNIETRLGSWFEVLGNQKFDQIVCNPPFVISPRSKIMYQDSGMRGDELCRTIVTTLPGYLNPGGIGQILVNWGVLPSGHEGIDDWLPQEKCEVLLQRFSTFEIEEYIQHWLGGTDDPTELQSWFDYYQELGFVRIGSGLVSLTKSM